MTTSSLVRLAWLGPGRSYAIHLVAASLLAVVAAGSGCDDRSAADGQGAEKKPAAAKTDAHAGHDHDNGTQNDKEKGHAEGDGHVHGAEHLDEVVLTPEAIRRNGIRIAQARQQALSSSFVAPARVAYNAEQTAHIGSAVKGRVVEIKVRVGDPVKKGDVLLVIDSPELGEAQSDFLQKRTAVESAKAAVDLAKEVYEQAKQLLEEQQGIPRTEVLKMQGELVAAQGAQRSAGAALTAAENRLHLLGLQQRAVEELAKLGEINPKYEILAPIEGRVIEREVTLGELVSPETEKLMLLANLGTIWVLADVPEAKLGEIGENAKVQIAVPALGGQTFDGTVSYVSPELDPSTRTARLRVEVPNPQRKLLPGMFARAEITAGGSSEPVVAIPEDAVQTVEGEPAIFVPVKGEANTFAKKQVGIGTPVGGMVPVFAGLKEGEQFVSSGSFILKAELGKAGAAHEH